MSQEFKKRKRGKLLSCVFFNDVLCSFRKSEKWFAIWVCEKCPEYARFMRVMDEEDERVMDEIDEIYRTGVYK